MNSKPQETPNQDDQGFHNEQKDEKITREDLSGINETVRGDDISELKKDERITHQQHGNRKYKMHKNESTADNSPRTSTGPGTV